MNMDNRWIGAVLDACRGAGEAILACRAVGAVVELKPDGSPISDADRRASRFIDQRLRALAPDVGVVCEEGSDDPGDTERFWLVDPLDGTREFLRGSPWFSVNVALVEQGRPVFGVVLAPASGVCWWGGARIGAFRDGRPVHARCMPPEPRVLASPGEKPAAGGSLIARVMARWPAARVEALPGAFKFCELAEGLADVYPRTVPSCAWDSAAGQALLEGAGGAVLDPRGEALGYARSPGWRNPAFIAFGDPSAGWQSGD